MSYETFSVWINGRVELETGDYEEAMQLAQEAAADTEDVMITQGVDGATIWDADNMGRANREDEASRMTPTDIAAAMGGLDGYPDDY